MIRLAFAGFFLLIAASLASAGTNGTFIGNQTNITTDICGEFDVIANLSATQWWAEVQLNTSEINFGQVKKGEITRRSYQIASRGNVDITIIPTLTSPSEIFSNLYFSRTTTGWKKIGDAELIFNLTQNKGLWSVLGASDNLKNLSGSEKGIQNIQLDLTDFDDIVPFDQQYENTVKFVVIPNWNSIL
jgi:hypothetical protein